MTPDELLLELQNPQVYSGREINAVHKPWRSEDVHICLVFPDTYEIGMSHAGIKILYHQLNRMEGVYAERSFLPERANLKVFQRHGFPLFSLESKMPLQRFDLVGFSLLSELNFTNVLQVLDLALLPLQAAARPAGPLVAAGGMAAVNPEPLADFIDFFALGDGELIFPDLVQVLRQARCGGWPKEKTLRHLASLESIYVPRLYPLEPRGFFLVPNLGKKRVRKRLLPDLGRARDEAAEIVPIGQTVFNRLTVEIARGCGQCCRFCQARSYYAPFRPKEPAATLEFIGRALGATGYEAFSLSSLSSGDYPWLADLLERLPALMAPGISFSVPSLRPATLSPELLATLMRFRRTGLTIVAEAGSERLRRVINKDVENREIFRAVELALEHRWQRVKMYFMLGLPTETDRDIEELISLLEQLSTQGKRLKFHVSFSFFVPKPHTPLQWAGREPLASLLEKMALIRRRLKRHRHLRLDFHSVQSGIVETIMARGDRRVAELVRRAYAQGEIFSAWDREFHYEIWEELIRELNLSGFLDEFPVATDFPWDFVDLDYRPEHLRQEYLRALAAEPTPACSRNDCAGCNGCFFGKSQIRAALPLAPASQQKVNEPEYDRVRIFFEKTGDFRTFSHLTLMAYLERLLRQSGLNFKTTEGFHPRLRMASLPPLPVFASGLEEAVELFVERGHSGDDLLTMIRQAAPAFPFRRVEICNRCLPLNRDLGYVEYEMTLAGDGSAIDQVRRLLLEGESLAFVADRLELNIDYGRNGQQRFAQMYRLLDPERKRTQHLVRRRLHFRHAL